MKQPITQPSSDKNIDQTNRAADMLPSDFRALIRSGKWTGPTAGACSGYVQTNLVILPEHDARDFAEFCRLNPRPCPVVARTAAGDPFLPQIAGGGDLRTDVPRYRVFRRGVLDAEEPLEIRDLWRDDFVSFLIGCSFTFENALQRAGLPVRHIEQGRNVPMYRTSIPCHPAGKFQGPLVVSMRPYPPEQVPEVARITGHFPTMHGGPIHWGNPAALGIADLSRPDYGEAVTINSGEIPVFWACGVTPQAALAAARPELAITHSPGCMFVTDLKDEAFYWNETE